MGFRFSRHLGRHGRVTLTKSGCAISAHSSAGSIGTRGGALLTGVPGLKYQFNWGMALVPAGFTIVGVTVILFGLVGTVPVLVSVLLLSGAGLIALEYRPKPTLNVGSPTLVLAFADKPVISSFLRGKIPGDGEDFSITPRGINMAIRVNFEPDGLHLVFVCEEKFHEQIISQLKRKPIWKLFQRDRHMVHLLGPSDADITDHLLSTILVEVFAVSADNALDIYE